MTRLGSARTSTNPAKGRLWRWGLGLALVAVTLSFVDADATWKNLRDARLSIVLIAVGLTVPQTLLMAWRWHYTAARVGLALPWSTAVREYYVSLLLNQTFFGVAGDIGRVVRQSGRTRAPVEPALRVVLIERMMGQGALVIALVASGVLWGRADLLEALMIGGLSLAALFVAIVLFLRHPLLASSPPGRWLRRLWTDAKTAVFGRAFPLQMGLSLVVMILLLAMFYACARAVQVPLSLTTTLLVVPWIFAATTVPVTVGGWGVREATAAGLFGLAGLEPAQGTAASVIFGATCLLGAAPGLLFMVPWRAEKRPSSLESDNDNGNQVPH